MEYSPSLGIEVEETMKMGSYEGDGTANRVFDIGFTPKVIWIYSTAMMDTAVAISDEIYASTDIAVSAYDYGKRSKLFQGIVPNGFKAGSAADSGINVNLMSYFWIASA